MDVRSFRRRELDGRDRRDVNETYVTTYGGVLCFIVQISRHTICVRRLLIRRSRYVHAEVVFTGTIRSLFTNASTELSQGILYNEDAIPNRAMRVDRLLVEVQISDYMLVSDIVERFKTTTPIVEFVSSSEIGLPVAVDERGLHYLLSENVCMDVSEMTSTGHGINDIYMYFYQRSLITTNTTSGTMPLVDTRGIRKLFLVPAHSSWAVGDLDNHEITFRYAAGNFRDTHKTMTLHSSVLIVEYSDGVREELGEQAYVDLMEEFEQTAGFSSLPMHAISFRLLWLNYYQLIHDESHAP